MQKRVNIGHIFIALVVVMIVLSACWIACASVFFGRKVSRDTPERDFSEYVWQDKEVPSSVTQIQAVTAISFGYNGPAYLRFNAAESFVIEMIEKDYGYNGTYSVCLCSEFFVAAQKDIAMLSSRDLVWWTPEKIDSPRCYAAQGHQSDDSRYLLVD